jgi:hypothetical protein
MSTDNLDRLADELVAGLTPVKPLRHPLIRILPWLGMAIAYAMAVTFGLGIRPDLPAKLHEMHFLTEIIWAAVVVASAALAGAWMAVPDARGQGRICTIPAVLAAGFALWAMTDSLGGGTAHNMPLRPLSWHFCATHALILGALPVAAMVLMSRRGATARPRMMSLMNILAAGALGWLALRFTCVSDDAAHIFLYHFLPFAAAGGVLAALARRLYRW